MTRLPIFVAHLFLLIVVSSPVGALEPPAKKLPQPGTVMVDDIRHEVILSAQVQFPEGKPCINEYGQRMTITCRAIPSCCRYSGRGPTETGSRKAYQDFVTKAATIGDTQIVKPWTPHFVFHGSGAIHKSGTGCIACPGGIIADNRFPIYDPKPTVRFDMQRVPPAGTQVYVRIHAISSTKP